MGLNSLGFVRSTTDLVGGWYHAGLGVCFFENIEPGVSTWQTKIHTKNRISRNNIWIVTLIQFMQHLYIYIHTYDYTIYFHVRIGGYICFIWGRKFRSGNPTKHGGNGAPPVVSSRPWSFSPQTCHRGVVFAAGGSRIAGVLEQWGGLHDKLWHHFRVAQQFHEAPNS